jgi:hypothetical protein
MSTAVRHPDHPLDASGRAEQLGDAEAMWSGVPAKNEGGDAEMLPVQSKSSSAEEHWASEKESSGSEGVAPNIF